MGWNSERPALNLLRSLGIVGKGDAGEKGSDEELPLQMWPGGPRTGYLNPTAGNPTLTPPSNFESSYGANRGVSTQNAQVAAPTTSTPAKDPFANVDKNPAYWGSNSGADPNSIPITPVAPYSSESPTPASATASSGSSGSNGGKAKFDPNAYQIKNGRVRTGYDKNGFGIWSLVDYDKNGVPSVNQYDSIVDPNDLMPQSEADKEEQAARIAALNRQGQSGAANKPYAKQALTDKNGRVIGYYDPETGGATYSSEPGNELKTYADPKTGSLMGYEVDPNGQIVMGEDGKPKVTTIFQNDDPSIQWHEGDDGYYMIKTDPKTGELLGEPTKVISKKQKPTYVQSEDGVVKIDPETGEATLVYGNKQKYGFTMDNDGNVYSTDPYTGKATLVQKAAPKIRFEGGNIYTPAGMAKPQINYWQPGTGQDRSDEGQEWGGDAPLPGGPFSPDVRFPIDRMGPYPPVSADNYHTRRQVPWSSRASGIPTSWEELGFTDPRMLKWPESESRKWPQGQWEGMDDASDYNERMAAPNSPRHIIPAPRPELEQFKGMKMGFGADAPMEDLMMQGGMPMMDSGSMPEEGWTPPVQPENLEGIGNRFGQPVDVEGIHKGTDLQAVEGTPLVAPVDGVVVQVNFDPKGLGLNVVIQDAHGHKHKLGHMLDTIVKPGDQVNMGDPVGKVGSTGNSTGPHLDYREQDQQGNYLSPEDRLGSLANMPMSPNTVGQEDQMGMGSDGFDPQAIKDFLYNTYKGWQGITNQAGNLDNSRPNINLWERFQDARKQLGWGGDRGVGVGLDYPEGTQWKTDDGFMSYENDPSKIDWSQPGPIDTEKQYGVDPSFYPDDVRQKLYEHNTGQSAGGSGSGSVDLDPAAKGALDNQRKQIDNNYAIALKQLEQDRYKFDSELEYQKAKDAIDQKYRQDMADWEKEKFNLEWEHSQQAAKEQRDWQTGERTGSQEWQSGEAQKNRMFELQKDAYGNAPWAQALGVRSPAWGMPGGPQDWAKTAQAAQWGMGQQPVGQMYAGGSPGFNEAGNVQPIPEPLTNVQSPYSGSGAGTRTNNNLTDPANIVISAMQAPTQAPQGGQTSQQQAYSGWVDPQRFLSMTPFERAALQMNVRGEGAAKGQDPTNYWNQYTNAMRNTWGAAGGPTQAPKTTSLQKATSSQTDILGKNQVANFFGQDENDYWGDQQKRWSTSGASGVSQVG